MVFTYYSKIGEKIELKFLKLDLESLFPILNSQNEVRGGNFLSNTDKRNTFLLN